MIRFYSSDIEKSGVLDEVESGHCCRVLRMKEGDVIEVVDGTGNAFVCEICDAHPKHTGVLILEKRREEKHWSPQITLAVAPTKNIDRIEWMLEKCVEIGVDRIVFLKCKRSERKDVKPERLNKIIVSAMKQSMKAKLPSFDGMVAFKDFVSDGTLSGVKVMGYCSDQYDRKELVKEYSAGDDIVIMIGPEGDFTPEEVELAVNNGFIPCTFGNTRLRTETAAIFALSAVHTMNLLDS